MLRRLVIMAATGCSLPLNPRRLLILRALGLGDLLCAVPALRALRLGLPDAEIVLCGRAEGREFAARFPRYLDGFIELPGFPGITGGAADPLAVADFLERVHRLSFDLAVQMHGDGAISNSLVSLLGARCTAGFFVPGGFCPDPETFLPFPAREPEVRRHLRLVEFLGMSPQGEHLEFDVSREDHQWLRALEGAHSLRFAHYVCIHPTARPGGFTWPTERFAEVGDELAVRGYRVVVSGDPRAAGEVASRMARPALNLAGKTDLGSLAALVSGARLLVCNDGAISQVAAALRVQSVVIRAPETERESPPLDPEIHHALYWSARTEAEEIVRALDSEVADAA